MANNSNLIKIFFQKRVLDNDWKESRQGVIRLDSLTEEIIEDILEFTYSGSVHVGSIERAEDLIVATDYFFLPKLKIVVGRFIELSTSHCNSYYEFPERYQCEELIILFKNIKKSICLNFVSMANEEDVKQLISRDDLHVSVEGD